MPAAPKARRYSFKPPFGTQLDRSHPLTQGLARCWLFNEGGGNTVYDLAQKDHIALSGSPTWTTSTMGLALKFNNTTSQFGSFSWTQPTQQISVEVWYNNAGSNVDGAAALFADSTDSFGFFYLTDGGTYDHKVSWGNQAGLDDHANKVLTDNAWHQIVITQAASGSSLQWYIDGVAVTDVDSRNNINSTVTFTRIGACQTTATSGYIALVRAWERRTLNATDVQRLYVAPFDMFQPRRRIWFNAIAGGSTTTKTIAVTQSQTVGLLKAVTKVLPTTESQTPAITRTTTKPLALTQSSTPLITKGITKIISVLGTITQFMPGAGFWPGTTGSSFAVTLQALKTKLVGISVTQSSTPMMVRAITKVLPLTQSSTPTVARIASFIRTFALTQSSTPTLLKAIAKPISLTQSGTASMTRAIAKTISLTQSSSAALLKAITKVISVSELSSANLSTIKVHLVVMALTQSSAVVMSRAITKVFSLTQSSALSFLKSITKPLALTQSVSVSFSALKVFIRNIAAATSSAVGMNRAIGKTISLTQSSSAGIQKAIAKVISRAESFLATVGRVFIPGGGGGVLYTQAISVTQASAVGLTKAVRKILPLTQSSTPLTPKRITKVISVAQSSFALLSNIFTSGAHLTVVTIATASRSVASSRRFIQKGLSLTQSTRSVVTGLLVYRHRIHKVLNFNAIKRVTRFMS